MNKAALALIFSMTILTTPAFAQGTPEQREACSDDAHKWCPYEIPDPDAVEQCLRKNLRNISKACQNEFKK
jgi:hypothetical protein